jgi:BirA family biotin operon repressor/biotin-[acetyl-CoA-carboxylase] ligase
MEPGVISLRVGLAVAETLDELTGVSPALKWPNDIVVDDRKLGGILCEMRWHGDQPSWLVVGVGLNVANAIPEDLIDSATSLTGRCPDTSPDVLAKPLTERLRRLDVVTTMLTPEERERYAARDWLRGRLLKDPVSGVVRGVDGTGALTVETAGGEVHALHSADLRLDSPACS